MWELKDTLINKRFHFNCSIFIKKTGGGLQGRRKHRVRGADVWLNVKQAAGVCYVDCLMFLAPRFTNCVIKRHCVRFLGALIRSEYFNGKSVINSTSFFFLLCFHFT